MANRTLTIPLLITVLLLFPSGLLYAGKKADSYYGDVDITSVDRIVNAVNYVVSIRYWPEIVGKEIPVKIRGAYAPGPEYRSIGKTNPYRNVSI